jgi:HEAT repeats
MARALLLAVAILAPGLAPAARAHIVYGTPSLHELARDADLVVRVRVARARRMVRLDGADHPRVERAVVDVVVLEALRGKGGPGLTFVPHGHGPAEYHDGGEALVFLRRIDRVPELAGTALADHVRWVSLQETSDAIPLGPRTRGVWTDAVRRYLSAEAIVDPVVRHDALREAMLALLDSDTPRIAASALRDLVRAPDSMIRPVDARRLERLVAAGRAPVTVRVGVLAELERRGLTDAPPRWATLLTGAAPRDRLVVVRAAAAHPSPAVTRALLGILESGDLEAASAAAASLGVPGNAIAVAPLEGLLAQDDPRLRFAAIRGLGGIESPEAVDALRRAAAFHPDPATRRRARAEEVVLQRRAHRAPP